jgi:DNA-binding MarR family transcriptional regulator
MDLLDSRQAGAAAEPCTPAVVALAKLGRWAGRQFANALAPIGLKQRHLGTLLELRAGPLAQQALGDALGIDAAQLVGLLNDLEAEGLVYRRRDPSDRRRHIVEISTLGRTRLASTDQAMAEIDAKLMTGLTPDQQAQFVALLRLVVERGGYDEDCADSSGACATENDEFALPPCPSSREGTAPG